MHFISTGEEGKNKTHRSAMLSARFFPPLRPHLFPKLFRNYSEIIPKLFRNYSETADKISMDSEKIKKIIADGENGSI